MKSYKSSLKKDQQIYINDHINEKVTNVNSFLLIKISEEPYYVNISTLADGEKLAMIIWNTFLLYCFLMSINAKLYAPLFMMH